MLLFYKRFFKLKAYFNIFWKFVVLWAMRLMILVIVNLLFTWLPWSQETFVSSPSQCFYHFIYHNCVKNQVNHGINTEINTSTSDLWISNEGCFLRLQFLIINFLNECTCVVFYILKRQHPAGNPTPETTPTLNARKRQLTYVRIYTTGLNPVKKQK